ncbi:MAM33 [Candida oxycetoniae]|uniref:MAM33 n=1 Tax=Candida oxycetoniae TaxID=497107 RepID=A0AAI9T0C8_9ASCO|nr:MAM33 [Candida oxycetoniae]KAI3406516.1 MAM33 [Candida oxycetoniae]
MSKLVSAALRANLAKKLPSQAPKLRSDVLFRSSSVLKPLMITVATRSFHQSPISYDQSAESGLNEVLQSESKLIETVPNTLDATYEKYLKEKGFELISKPGTANVELVKTDPETGNIIHVYFDIDEVTDIPTEDLEALESGDLEEEADSLDQILCNVKILIENQSKNTGLFLNLFLQNTESSFMIDFVNVQNDVAQFMKNINENNEFIDKFNYQGPKFGELDESLQTEFENYLVAKGVDNDLADFIVAYSDFKEENEYRLWVKAVSKFLN